MTLMMLREPLVRHSPREEKGLELLLHFLYYESVVIVPSPHRGDAYINVGSRTTQEQLAEG